MEIYGKDSGDEEISGSGDGEGGEEEDEEALEEILMSENYFYLNPILRVLAFCHLMSAIGLMLAYFQLKVKRWSHQLILDHHNYILFFQVPVIIFKNEKEVARKLEFDGMWITVQPSEEGGVRAMFDGIVISAPYESKPSSVLEGLKFNW